MIAAWGSSGSSRKRRCGLTGTMANSGSAADAVRSFEALYLERARAITGARAAGAELIVLERAKPGLVPADATALAAWWSDPDAAGDAILLPNPWDARDALELYERRAWELAQELVSALGARLDALHGERRGAAYWRLMLEPWALMLAAVVLDRRLFLVTAAALAPEARVLGDPTAPEPPASMPAAVGAFRSDTGNRALLTSLAEALGIAVEPGASTPPPTGPPAPRAFGPALLALARTPGPTLRAAARAGERRALGRASGRRIVLVGQTGIPLGGLVRLARRVPGLRVAPAPRLVTPAPVPPPADPARRESLGSSLRGEPDATAVAALVPGLLPRSVLEGLPALVEASRRTHGEPAPALAGNYALDDVQNEFLARCAAAGMPIAHAQHGGSYFQAAVNGVERLERPPDRPFVSWGRVEGAQAAPSPHLAHLRGAHRGGDAVVLIEDLQPPDVYLLRFASQPQGGQAYESARRLDAFVRSVKRTRRQLVLKRFPAPPGETRRPRALEALPHTGPVRSRAATDWLRHARIAVVAYPDTPFIEAMVIGVPTIGLWDPKYHELRDDARAPFEALADAGVIHVDPVAAAALVDDVYDSADAWWKSPEVAAARRLFIDRFAVEGSWLDAWSRILNELAAEPRSPPSRE
jgi:hypothetical protein